MFHQLAPPSSALGQLQRGRGAGWLYASTARDGTEMLLACLENDPRWDGQVERRSWYYATLARKLGLTAKQIAEAKIDNGYGLGIEMLGDFARLGDETAITALREKLVPGPVADRALSELERVPRGLDLLYVWIAEAFEGNALDDLVQSSIWLSKIPWQAWARAEPRIRTAVRNARAQVTAAKREQVTVTLPIDATLREILEASPMPRFPDPLVERFAVKASTSDLRRLRAAAIGPLAGGRVFALRVLAKRRDPYALDLAEHTFAANASGVERSSLYSYTRALESKDTLPVARRWLDVGDSRAGIAATLMSLHSEADDVPAIRGALRRAWDEQSMYTICSLIEALGRHSGQGPYPELRMIYADVGYSYARKRTVEAMSAVDPEFRHLFARECLWDCEIETRDVGIAQADPRMPAVVERIAELTSMQHDSE